MDTNHLTARPKRPVGVSILTAIYLLAGLIAFVFYLLSPNELTAETLYLLFLVVIILLASIGFFMGYGWGWWMVTAICQINILFILDALYLSLSKSPNYVLINIIEITGILLFNALIMVYLFQRNVFDYYVFKVESKFFKYSMTLILGIMYYLSILSFRI